MNFYLIRVVQSESETRLYSFQTCSQLSTASQHITQSCWASLYWFSTASDVIPCESAKTRLYSSQTVVRNYPLRHQHNRFNPIVLGFTLSWIFYRIRCRTMQSNTIHYAISTFDLTQLCWVSYSVNQPKTRLYFSQTVVRNYPLLAPSAQSI